MGQIFPPESNKISKLLILLVIVLVGGTLALAAGVVHSPYLTGVGDAVPQPVQFSHQHHVLGLGLDCRYCHTSVETSSHANYPDTATCMTCHSQIWNHSSILQNVRDSYEKKKPLRWIQVYQVPDHVYFDHSVHLHGGIGCVTCHGEISRMPVVRQVRSFMMKDCLECHLHPEKSIRPRNQIYNEKWRAENQGQLGKQLMNQNNIHPIPLTNCNVCHR